MDLYIIFSGYRKKMGTSKDFILDTSKKLVLHPLIIPFNIKPNNCADSIFYVLVLYHCGLTVETKQR